MVGAALPLVTRLAVGTDMVTRSAVELIGEAVGAITVAADLVEVAGPITAPARQRVVLEIDAHEKVAAPAARLAGSALLPPSATDTAAVLAGLIGRARVVARAAVSGIVRNPDDLPLTALFGLRIKRLTLPTAALDALLR
jgi:hypothetical protein